MPETVEIACFRIVQEALTNVMRHAGARNVFVELQLNGAELLVMIRDDGVGFDHESARAFASRGGSLGLLSMQERAELIGGRLEIESARGQGTVVRIHVPVVG